LKAIRLSVKTDETTSPARQDEAITAEAERRGMTIVGTAEDLNVSASKVGPFERPELGEWLARPEDFDGIIWWRLDRAVRSMSDLHALAAWAKRYGKRLIFASGPGGTAMELDMSSPVAELIATILAFAAQMESQAIRERVTSSHAYLRRNGRWGGGMFPYGYMPIENPDGEGWVLVEDPDTAPVLRELARRVIAGESQTSICRDFIKRGIPTPRDYTDARSGRDRDTTRRWSQTATAAILRSRGMLGEATFDGRPVLDAEGMPLKRAVPLVSLADWKLLQDALAGRSTPHKPRTTGAALLLHVGQCGCGQPLYIQRYNSKGRPYAYYGCKESRVAGNGSGGGTCSSGRARADWLEAETVSIMFQLVGDLELTERKLIPGTDHAGDLEAVEHRMGELRDDREAGLYSGPKGTEEYRAMYLRLQAKRDQLANLPYTPDRWEDVPTGSTFAERWAGLESTEDRRAFLLASRVKVILHPEPVRVRALLPGTPDAEGSRVSIELPPDLTARVREHAASRGR
jgi:DNA invertase Pin-like site-specific DNA recombinase